MLNQTIKKRMIGKLASAEVTAIAWLPLKHKFIYLTHFESLKLLSDEKLQEYYKAVFGDELP